MILLVALALAADSQALIWGGGKTEAEARASLKGLDTVPVVLGKGFPQIVRSDDVPGLKPGFVIAVAGYCSAGHRLLPLMKAFNKGVYERTVQPKTPPADDACPKKKTSIISVDVDAVLDGENIPYQGYSPGSCNDRPARLRGLDEVSRSFNVGSCAE